MCVCVWVGGGAWGGRRGHLISTFLSQSFLSIIDRGGDKDTWNTVMEGKKKVLVQFQMFSVDGAAASSKMISHPGVTEVIGLAIRPLSYRFQPGFSLKSCTHCFVFLGTKSLKVNLDQIGTLS